MNAQNNPNPNANQNPNPANPQAGVIVIDNAAHEAGASKFPNVFLRTILGWEMDWLK